MKKGFLATLLLLALGLAGWFGWQYYQSRIASLTTPTVRLAEEVPAPPARSNPMTDLEGNILSSPLNAYDN